MLQYSDMQFVPHNDFTARVALYTFAGVLSLLLIHSIFVIKSRPETVLTDKELQEISRVYQTMGDLRYERATMRIGTTTISVALADTEQKRVRGLAGISSLSRNEGMLFLFETPGAYPIWMRGMQISLDILWLNENVEVVHIEEEVRPDTYPKIFQSRQLALFVLELPVGSVSRFGVEIGDQISFVEEVENE